jgi:hypothetical protein
MQTKRRVREKGRDVRRKGIASEMAMRCGVFPEELVSSSIQVHRSQGKERGKGSDFKKMHDSRKLQKNLKKSFHYFIPFLFARLPPSCSARSLALSLSLYYLSLSLLSPRSSAARRLLRLFAEKAQKCGRCS